MENTSLRAIDAIQEAQKIAFAPFVFQATISLRKLGVFDLIFSKRKAGGITMDEISKELSISTYGISVLLEIAESSNIVSKDAENKYVLTTTGYFLNYNETVNANINFTNDVCYKGLYHLNESIKTGKPEGLKELGNWDTIYEGLSQLPSEIQKSWFEFDHHYSDHIFSDALELVFRKKPKQIFDIGANTGKFTLKCCNHDPDVAIKMIDLPGQLNKAIANIEKEGFSDRVTSHEINWLKDNPKIPTGADLIWLSQFLDCFSKEEIFKILKTCVDSMDENTELFIIETYTDRQRFDNAKFILEATSLYFTVLANGNSKMYKAEEVKDIALAAGLEIKEDIALGEYHTVFVFGKK